MSEEVRPGIELIPHTVEGMVKAIYTPAWFRRRYGWEPGFLFVSRAPQHRFRRWRNRWIQIAIGVKGPTGRYLWVLDYVRWRKGDLPEELDRVVVDLAKTLDRNIRDCRRELLEEVFSR